MARVSPPGRNDEIRRLRRAGQSVVSLSQAFGLSAPRIYQITYGENPLPADRQVAGSVTIDAQTRREIEAAKAEVDAAPPYKSPRAWPRE